MEESLNLGMVCPRVLYNMPCEACGYTEQQAAYRGDARLRHEMVPLAEAQEEVRLFRFLLVWTQKGKMR